MAQETQPVAIGFNGEEVEMVLRAWATLDQKDSPAQPDKMISAYKSRLKERVLDVTWTELNGWGGQARALSRERLRSACREIFSRYPESSPT